MIWRGGGWGSHEAHTPLVPGKDPKISSQLLWGAGDVYVVVWRFPCHCRRPPHSDRQHGPCCSHGIIINAATCVNPKPTCYQLLSTPSLSDSNPAPTFHQIWTSTITTLSLPYSNPRSTLQQPQPLGAGTLRDFHRLSQAFLRFHTSIPEGRLRETRKS